MRLIILNILLLVSRLANCQTIDGGNGHALILDKKGNVWTMGRNNFGQLGDSSLVNSSNPKQVSNLKGIYKISRGYDHSIALDSTGNLYLWGRNNYGQLGYPSVLDQLVPKKLLTQKDFVAIEGGHWHTIALKKDGTVMAWGHNFFGELGNGNREHKSFPVYVMQKVNSTVSILNNVVQIASVGYHTLALKKDGTLWGWGSNDYNELGYKGPNVQVYAAKINSLPKKIKEIAVGWHHSVALDVDGNLWVWGSDPAFQFGETTTNFYKQPFMFSGLPKFTKIACGSWHSLAIDENENVWAWGKNHYGMLGTGDSTSSSTPVLIKSLKNITDIGGGCFESIAIDKQGKIYTFGDNPSGQLGIGNLQRCYIPKLIPLNINGNMQKKSIITENTKPVDKESFSKADTSIFEKETLNKIAKYSILALSIILNIYLYRKVKKLS